MRTIFVLISLVVAMIADAAPLSSVAGKAFCVSGPGANDCYVGWKWDKTPRAAQWVQVFDPDINDWRMIAETAAESTGKSLDPVPTGLYRVRSCDDPRQESSCMDSMVFWAPFRPTSVDDFPPKLITEHGRVFTIGKNMPYEYQASQYNVLTLATLIESWDRERRPPMTPPERRWNASGFQQPLDTVLNNVYDFYEEGRLPTPSTTDVSAKEKVGVEWIGDIPADQQRAFRAQRLKKASGEAITFSAEKPAHVVYVLADIRCQHCRRMTREIEQFTALGVTVRFFAFPLAGPYSGDGRKMTEIWCASDRKDAFRRAMLNEVMPSSPCANETVVYQYALAKQLGFNGSPTMVTEEGDVIGGYLTPEQMIRRLESPQKQD